MIYTEPQEIILKSVNQLVDFVKPTYGPESNKVIIDKGIYKMVIDDGVQIARDFQLEDEAQNSVVNLVKEVAIRTNEREGDGTTGSLIVLQSIMNNVQDFSRKTELELKQGLEEAKTQLLEQAQDISTVEDLEKVARISFDDEDVAKQIASAWDEVGKDGIVSVEKSKTLDTYYELSSGIKIDSGYVSRMLPNKMDDPKIFLTDYTLASTNDVMNLAALVSAKKNGNPVDLVIFAESIEAQALEFLVYNQTQGQINIAIINLPKENTEEILQDLSVLTGAKLFSRGTKPSEVTMEDLGDCVNFIATQSNCVIKDPQGDEDKIKAHIESLQDDKKRLAFIENKIATIYVGGNTDNEQKALRYKVEDAVNAVHSAYKSGVVAGGGNALKNIETSSDILNKALKAPNDTLNENSGVQVGYENEVYNVVTGEHGDAMEVGVIDPVNVLIAGIESAVSIASLLITTKGIIVDDIRDRQQD